jgi:hypothetical protein
MLQSSKDRARHFIVDLSLEFPSCPVPMAVGMTIRQAPTVKIYARAAGRLRGPAAVVQFAA